MTEADLKKRTKALALRVMKLVDALPKSLSGRVIANQLVRSGTAVGANYCSACRGRSKAEFVAKLGVVVEEADESAYWLELVMEGRLLSEKRVRALWNEVNEITAIMTASHKTASKQLSAARKANPKPKP